MNRPAETKRHRLRRARRRLKGWVLYLGVLKLRLVLRLLPRGAALELAGGLGELTCRLLARERRGVLENLKLALGAELTAKELERLSRLVFVHQAKNLADILRGTRINQNNISSVVSTEGVEHLRRAREKGRGVILIGGHIGNWEMLAAWVSLSGYPLSVIGRRLNYPQLDRLLARTREAWGMEVIDRDRAAKPLLRAIRDNHVIGILIDQDTRLDGVFVPFFGRPTHTPTGPISIALKTGAAIVPMAIFRQADDSYLISVHPEVTFERDLTPAEAVERMTAQLSGILEDFIRRDPSQWVWMHRRWRQQPAAAADKI